MWRGRKFRWHFLLHFWFQMALVEASFLQYLLVKKEIKLMRFKNWEAIVEVPFSSHLPAKYGVDRDFLTDEAGFATLKSG